LHYDWTLKALKAGKHVLLEKPATSNGEEARSLFHHSILSSPNAPVLLEARHYQFHPAWQTFLSLFDPSDVESADAVAGLPAGFFPPNDIRFNYSLAGGTLLDLGTYNLSAIRGIFGADPTEVTSATPRLMPHPYDQQCEQAMQASYTFPNGGTATILCDLSARVTKTTGTWSSWLFNGWPNFTPPGMPPLCSVTLREKHGVEDDMNITTQKTIALNNFMGPHMWHRIDINTTTSYRSQSGEIVKTEKHTETKKAYTWPKGKGEGEDWWPTYRYMLEAFVDRIKGREGSGAWVDGEESIRQMECIDRTYEKAGMAIRPTSESMRSADRGEH
jgi:predicted dehydrogenase